MYDQSLVIIALLVQFIAGGIYIKGTLSGGVKPNRVTYFLWFILPVVAFAGAVDEGVGMIALYTLLNGFISLTVFLVSFLNKDGYWKLGRFDYFMGAMAIIGVVLWQATGNGNLAIIFALVADFFAGLPTLKKAYQAPDTENIVTYFLGIVGAIIIMSAIGTWDFAHYAFPVYLVALNAMIVFAMCVGPRASKNMVLKS